MPSPAFTVVDPDALDLDPKTNGHHQGGSRARQETAGRSRLESRRRRHPREGRREAGAGVYYTANANSAKVAEAIQGYLRKIGVDWRLNPWDSTIASVKMAEQDYEIWSVTVPYLSAGDLMNIYFDSANIPTPNRMNWKDAETDEWLKQGRSALTETDRTKYYALVQQKVMREHLWIPVLNINMDQVANKRIKCARPHMLYQNTFYKGLDVSLLETNNKGVKRCAAFSTGVAALLAAGAASTAEAQTLRMMKSLDAPHYDGQRTTWSPTSDIVNMFQDTLVAMDWDGKTPIPYLAKSWTISPDGKLYTFKLRDDVTFCSGKKFTAADVIYSFKRLTAIRTQGAARLARRQYQGAARARPLHRRVRAERAVLRSAAPAHDVHHRHPQPGERGDARQGLRHQGRSTAPGRGVSRAGSRAPRSC